jgi:hypothetical protein
MTITRHLWMINALVAFVFSCGLVAALPLAQAQNGLDAVAGDWRLLDAAAAEATVPQHRIDLRFSLASGTLKGAILSRAGGAEMPLANAGFDGSTLRFQMQAPSGRAQSDMPTMVMIRNGGKFEGHWTNGAGQPVGPALKLIKAGK